MYHCFLRAKQYELLAIKDSISKIKEADITPIIEPVKKNPRDLLSCVKCVKENQTNFVLIVNPSVTGGELTNNSYDTDRLIETVLAEYPNIDLGFIVNQYTTTQQIENALNNYSANKFSLIHFGELHNTQNITESLSSGQIVKNIFIDETVSNNYINKFASLPKILIRDGFRKLNRNADYRSNLEEYFSDLHQNYTTLGFDGFGDFSIVGDNYSDGGGQAVTAAIHLTYSLINDSNTIYIQHFLSEDRPYAEDLQVIIEEAFSDAAEFLQQRQDILYWSTSCQEIIQKYTDHDRTNLAYIKKLSIKHHFELMHFLKMICAY